LKANNTTKSAEPGETARLLPQKEQRNERLIGAVHKRGCDFPFSPRLCQKTNNDTVTVTTSKNEGEITKGRVLGEWERPVDYPGRHRSHVLYPKPSLFSCPPYHPPTG